MKILFRVIVVLLFIAALGMRVEARAIDDECLPGVNETESNVICPDEMGDSGNIEANVSEDSGAGDYRPKKRKRKAAKRAFKRKLISLRVAYHKFKEKRARRDGLHTIFTSSKGVRIALLIKDGVIVKVVATKNNKNLVTRIVKEEEVLLEEEEEIVDPEAGTTPSCPEGTEPCVIVVDDEETGQAEYFAWCCDVIDV